VTIVDEHYAVAPNISEGWLAAVRMLDRVSSYKTIHLVLRILDPAAEDPTIRTAAQQLIDDHNAKSKAKDEKPDIDTTRNTIFPASYARRTDGPAELAAYYRERYTKAGLLGFPDNKYGTYFGRVVAYPRADDDPPADQLTETVRKLKVELKSGSNKSSRYEINIFNERKDTRSTSFPCLAHLSVHMHERKLHMQAIYRNEFLVGRAYGNYLGLGELQVYIAAQVGLQVGELLMTLGHVEMDSTKGPIRAMLKRLDA
jgi:thymidylate synthase